jgi:hypothetical protein
MNAISRRRTLVLLAGTSLAGCSTIASLTTSQLDADLGTLSSGLAAVENFLTGLGINLIPASVVQEAQNVIAQIQANSAGIIGTIAPNQQLLTAISNGVTTLAAILTPFFPAVGAIAVAVQAALSLVGLILQEAGVAVPTTPAAAASAQFKAAAPMTGVQARAYMQQIAVSGIH